MDLRVAIRSIVLIGAAIWLAPALALAGGAEEADDQPAASTAAAGGTGAGLPDTPQRPWTYGSHAELKAATGLTLPALSEAPMLAQMVSSGTLPPVAERVPDEPLIVVPIEQIGSYGGQMNTTIMDGPVTWWFPAYWLEDPPVQLRPDARTWYPNWLLGVDQSADDRTITLRLRPGMKWSDGTPFTTGDLAFWFDDMNMNTELHPSVPTSLNVGGSPAQGRRIDDHTFELSFAAALPNFALRQLTLPQYMWSMGFIAEPKHYLSQFHISYNAEANDLAKAGGFDDWTQLFNARQGPYGKSSDDIGRPVLEAWLLQEAATDYALWERNPFYWKVDIAGNQLPYFDRVQDRSAATKESFMIAALGGEVDFVASILTIEDFPVLTQNAEAGGFEVRLWQKRAGAGVNYFFRQTYKPDPVMEEILRDKRFRRALSLAINRAEINELLYFGKGTPSQAAVPPGSVYHVPEHFQRDAAYDPDEANRILDEMGLEMGADGIRRRPDGKELFVKIEGYHEQETPITSTAELVKNYWEAVGVKTDFDFREDNSFDGKRSADEVMIASHVIDMLPDSIYEGSLWSPPSFGWWSEELANVYFAEGVAGLRAAGMEPDLLRFFELSEQFAQTAGEDERVAIANQIGELWADNLWMVGTVGGDLPHPALVKNDMGNVASQGFATYFTFYQIPHLPAQYFRRQ